MALAVAAIGAHSFSSENGDAINGTLHGAIADMVSGTGASLRRTNEALEDQQVVARLLASQRASYSGVSLDEEMADLMKFQRAFQASARVMNTVDSMLELIVTRLGN